MRPIADTQLGTRIREHQPRKHGSGLIPDGAWTTPDDRQILENVYAPGSHYLAYARSDIRLICEQENISDSRPEEWAMTYSSDVSEETTADSDWSLEF